MWSERPSMMSRLHYISACRAPIQLPANVAAVVFGVYLSAQAAYQLDRKSPTPDGYRGPPLRVASNVRGKGKKIKLRRIHGILYAICAENILSCGEKTLFLTHI